jgi:hypothetical protein
MINLSSRRALFWDINENDIERVLVDSDEWVILRVFQYGSLQDIQAVIELYGVMRSKQVLSSLELPPVASAMAYLFLDIDRYKKYAA